MSDELLFIFYCCNMLFNMWHSSTGDAFIRFFFGEFKQSDFIYEVTLSLSAMGPNMVSLSGDN